MVASEAPDAVGDTDPPLTDEVVASVAAARSVDPLDLPPLNESINPTALNTLFSSYWAEDPDYEGRITFAYAECDVAVAVDGGVEVTARADGDPEG